MIRNQHHLFTAACALFAAGAASAQSVVPEFGYSSYSLEWEGSSGFGEAVAVHFDPDALPDVFTVVDGDVYIAHSPGDYDARSVAITGGWDLAPYSDDGGDPDEAVVVGPAGLQRIAYSASAPYLTTQTLQAGTWTGALAVETHQVEGGAWEVCGLMSDGLELRKWKKVGEVLFEASYLTLPSHVEDFAIGNFDPTDGDEVAVARAGGFLEIYSRGGVLLTSYEYSTLATVDIGRIRQANGLDAVGWLSGGSAGWQYLASVGVGGVTLHESFLDVQATTLSFADVDGDGSDEAFIGHQLSYHLVVFANLGESKPKFSTSQSGSFQNLLVGPTGQAPGNFARPAVADFDGDGDVDVCMGVESTGRLYFGMGSAVDETAITPKIIVDGGRADVVLAQGMTKATLEIGVAVPITQVAPGLELEVVCFRRDDLTVSVESDSFPIVRVPLDAGTTRGSNVEVHVSVDLPGVDIPSGEVFIEDLFFWTQRIVDPADPTFVAPAEAYGLEASEFTEFEAYLESISPTGETIPIGITNYKDFPPGDEDGSVSCLPTVPEFEDDDPPRPNSSI